MRKWIKRSAVEEGGAALEHKDIKLLNDQKPLSLTQKVLLKHEQMTSPKVLHQFACPTCNHFWWRVVQTCKPVSRCRHCSKRYEALPRDSEFGISHFTCPNRNCGGIFYSPWNPESETECSICKTIVTNQQPPQDQLFFLPSYSKLHVSTGSTIDTWLSQGGIGTGEVSPNDLDNTSRAQNQMPRFSPSSPPFCTIDSILSPPAFRNSRSRYTYQSPSPPAFRSSRSRYTHQSPSPPAFQSSRSRYTQQSPSPPAFRSSRSRYTHPSTSSPGFHTYQIRNIFRRRLPNSPGSPGFRISRSRYTHQSPSPPTFRSSRSRYTHPSTIYPGFHTYQIPSPPDFRSIFRHRLPNSPGPPGFRSSRSRYTHETSSSSDVFSSPPASQSRFSSPPASQSRFSSPPASQSRFSSPLTFQDSYMHSIPRCRSSYSMGHSAPSSACSSVASRG